MEESLQAKGIQNREQGRSPEFASIFSIYTDFHHEFWDEDQTRIIEQRA
jgi:hypothetical protein